MLTVTETAADQLKTLMKEEGEKVTGLRMMVVEGGCSGYSYQMEFAEKADPRDLVVEHFGVKVYIDQQSAILLDEAVIDYINGLQGGFTIRNPKASSSCGCGKSFQA